MALSGWFAMAVREIDIKIRGDSMKRTRFARFSPTASVITHLGAITRQRPFFRSDEYMLCREILAPHSRSQRDAMELACPEKTGCIPP